MAQSYSDTAHIAAVSKPVQAINARTLLVMLLQPFPIIPPALLEALTHPVIYGATSWHQCNVSPMLALHPRNQSPCPHPVPMLAAREVQPAWTEQGAGTGCGISSTWQHSCISSTVPMSMHCWSDAYCLSGKGANVPLTWGLLPRWSLC